MNVSKASDIPYVELKRMDVVEFFTIIDNIEKKEQHNE